MKAGSFPYHIFLLPLFFVLHTTTEHWLYIDTFTLFTIVFHYCIGGAMLLLLFYLFFKKKNKAGLMVFILLSINFFFPEIHRFIRTYSPWPFLSRYLFIVPLLLLFTGFVFITLYKSISSFKRATLYLNILFCLLVLVEIFTLSARTLTASKSGISTINKVTLSSCDTCAKPDIYFLVFDEYSSSLSLKEDYNYDNSFLDTFLIQKGFTILTHSKSNYNITNFSIASLTNMSYLHIQNPDEINSLDYAEASGLTGDNKLCIYLSGLGYDIYNYSLFDIGEKKAISHYYFTFTSAEIIKNKTFIHTLYNQTGWNFFSRKTLLNIQQKKYTEAFDNIKENISKIKEETLRKTATPKFIYGHLLLPHPPFFMDKTTPYSIEQLVEMPVSLADAYLKYVYYTNTIIRDIVNSIQQNTGNKAVIIIMGDHGFRPPLTKEFPEKYFKNQNAVYLPGGNYKLLYDSISGVNQFRAILNTLFNQRLPMLEDKQYFLRDRQ